MAYKRIPSLEEVIGELNCEIIPLAKRLEAVEPFLEQIENQRIRAMFEKRILKQLSPLVLRLESRLRRQHEKLQRIHKAL